MAVLTRWSYKRGGREAGFHCKKNIVAFYFFALLELIWFVYVSLTVICFKFLGFVKVF